MSIGDDVIQRAEDHLIEFNPAFTNIIHTAGPCTIGSIAEREDPFTSLVNSIVSQQLSTGAASTISGRLRITAGGELSPATLTALATDSYRAAGLSGAKTRTIQGLAQQVASGELDLAHLSTSAPDDDVMRQLTALWGIGTWTVHMFMIFTLTRLDVWPVGDLGVRKGWQLIHGRQGDPGQKEFQTVADALSPYRSVAAWYCWRQLEITTNRA